ncbi:MAG: amidohydrolase family protein, partial [Planctomycetota bacterium]
MLRLLLAVVLASTAAVLAQPASLAPPGGLRENQPSTFALTNATVVVRPGETLDGATIVIRDGRIVSVGEDAPADATTIDLVGHTIYAGFINAYAETDASGFDEDSYTGHWNDRVHPHLDATDFDVDAEHARKAGFVAQAVSSNRGIFRGTVALRATNDEGRVITHDLGRSLKLTVERQPWGRAAKYPRSPMGAVALARQTMYDAQWYRDAGRAIADDPTLGPIDAQPALAALQPVIDGDLPLWVVCDDELFVLRADRFADEFEVDAVVVASGDEFRRADLVAESGRAMIVPVNFPKAPDVTSPAKANAVDLQTLMTWDLSPSNPKYLHDRGLDLAFTTHGLDDHDDFLPNVRRAIVRGLPEDAAVEMLTTKAALLCGAADQLGTIEPGKLASLTILSSNLADDEAEVVEVWIEGRRHEFDPAPTGDLVGTWDMGGQSLTLTDTGGKLGDVDLKNVTRSPDGVTFTLDATTFDQTGVASVSLTLVDDQLRGTVALPDGTRQPLTATKTDAEAEASGSDTPEVDTVPVLTDAPEKEATDGVPTELQTTDDQTGTASTPEASPERVRGVLEVTPTTRPTTNPSLTVGARADDRPLFEPNYPLGAYGRKLLADSSASRDGDDEAGVDVKFVDFTVWTNGPRGVINRSVVEI